MIRKWFKIKTSDIALVQFLLEGYEGAATISTLDPRAAVLQVLIMPDFTGEMENVLDHLKHRFDLQEIFLPCERAFLC
ncbi:MAG: DUF4911 domain-containing protein [Smithellaceae bacterium]|nr:DUF4911 domain-containing protein [Syntrophaceae bacterium]MDD4240097.1 DUF4911 domain-containing protein [Smithellaceae bacterium]MDD4464304.1 DUF4911 domain-containing protein [Desulfobacterales bacterium]NLX51461.1 DUF4911 domain-containing protein [Deltaproteobacteria bacterium]